MDIGRILVNVNQIYKRDLVVLERKTLDQIQTKTNLLIQFSPQRVSSKVDMALTIDSFQGKSIWYDRVAHSLARHPIER